MTQDAMLDRFVALHDELHAIRDRVKPLPLDSMERWVATIRVNEITEELALLRAEYEAKMGIPA